ncbi:unnamed protein product [Hermetia illucens]|uniref:Transposase domain-containing protein n=1 Tax=Hermetia illucens TaxID=343691 RepID=A0A7R8UII7_HERIL|nr:unnamed protein product [Hermetia illucens]
MNRSGRSKRTMSRLIKEERERLQQKLVNDEANDFSHFSENDIEIRERVRVVEEISQIKDNLEETGTKSLKENLRSWYIKYSPSRQVFDELLKILRIENLDVPKSTKTIIGNSTEIVVKDVPPGEYWHYGICQQLQKVKELLKDGEKVVLDIGIDGLPLYKSSNKGVWPILGKVVNENAIKVFLIGTYLGPSKPNSLKHYLLDFVTEVNNLTQNGVEINGRTLRFEIRAFICDAPAKVFICGTVGHTALNGCIRCTQKGKSIEGVTTFQTEVGEIVTDNHFSERIFPEIHKKCFRNIKTPLEKIGVRMISQFPLDVMHLLDLGIIRKILIRLFEKKTAYKICKENKKKISDHLVSLRPFIPKEFSRKPRSILSELQRFKATELRQFGLYTGIVVLKDNVHVDLYYHFLLLYCFYRLLLCPKNYRLNIANIQEMINYFVQNFPVVYRQNSVTYNVHSLLHLPDSVREHGIVSDYSAYNFENYLQILKKYIKKPSGILQQINNKQRHEIPILHPTTPNFKSKNGKIISYSCSLYYLSLHEPNCYCAINPYIPIKLTGFIKENGMMMLTGKRFKNLSDFFTEPVSSKNILVVCLADKELSNDEEKFEIKDINCKLIILPWHEENWLIMPLLHSCDQ